MAKITSYIQEPKQEYYVEKLDKKLDLTK